MADRYAVLRKPADIRFRQVDAVDRKHFIREKSDLFQKIDDILAVFAEAHLVVHFRFLDMHGVADVSAFAVVQHRLIPFLRRRPGHIGSGPDRKHVIFPVPALQGIHLPHGLFCRLNKHRGHAVVLAGILEGPDEHTADAG